jgi:hypothetical protein
LRRRKGEAPAVEAGALWTKGFATLSHDRWWRQTFLIVNGLIILIAERLKTRGTRPLEGLSWASS